MTWTKFRFTVEFRPINESEVMVLFDGKQIGHILDDNSAEADFYRYHDIFHFCYLTYLAWSPVLQKLEKLGNVPSERDIRLEECISLIVFNTAKRKKYFQKVDKYPDVDRDVPIELLKQVKELTEYLSLKENTLHNWETAILEGYRLFNELVKNGGGSVRFDLVERTSTFIG